MSSKILTIIIPVFNEEKTIKLVLDRVKAVSLVDNVQKEIVVVDDRSNDASQSVISEYQTANPDLNIKYSLHQKNQGKGAAIHTGIKESGGNFVIIQDADLEYDPEEINVLLKPMVAGKADVVYGSRFMGGNPHRVLFYWHSLGNHFLTLLSNMLSNLNLTDMETGYKLFSSSVIKNLQLREKRFGFEPEVTAKIAKIPNVRIFEVGISYFGRRYEEGKKIGWRDGVWAIVCIFRYNLFGRPSLPIETTSN